MAFVAQKPFTSNGVNYIAEDIVPEAAVTRRLRDLGFVAVIPDALIPDLEEQRKRELEEWDPAGHTINEVANFVREHPEQRDRVIESERGGKDRTGLYDTLSEMDDELEAQQRRREVEAFKAENETIESVVEFAEAHPEAISRLRITERAGKNRARVFKAFDEIESRDELEPEDEPPSNEPPLREGDETIEPGSQPQPEPPNPPSNNPEVIPTGYNPADATVPDVLTYVRENPDELEAVLAAEREGRDRTTLISQLEELRPA